MMAQVDAILQVVIYHQVIAIHSSILGNIVDSKLSVSCRPINPDCR